MKHKKFRMGTLGFLLVITCGCAPRARPSRPPSPPPVRPGPPAPERERQVVRLYFATDDFERLALEERLLKPSELTPQRVVELLIAGPGEAQHEALLPPTTKVRQVTVREGVATVDLSADFLKDFRGGDPYFYLAVYSLVNTLTELSGIEEVQFLIDGQTVEAFGGIPLNEPLRRDESLLE